MYLPLELDQRMSTGRCLGNVWAAQPPFLVAGWVDVAFTGPIVWYVVDLSGVIVNLTSLCAEDDTTEAERR